MHFLVNCTRILTRAQGKQSEDMFLVKIANKGTSLKQQNIWLQSVKILDRPDKRTCYSEREISLTICL